MKVDLDKKGVCERNVRWYEWIKVNVNRIHFVAKLIAEINTTATTTTTIKRLKVEIPNTFYWTITISKYVFYNLNIAFYFYISVQ